MTTLNNRQQALAKLIAEKAISKQEELIPLLKKEYKIETTQAMVSRDLQTLGCIKIIHEKKRIYAIPEKNTQREILQLGVKSIQHNESTIVVHTSPGLAPFVGDAIDQANLDIIGCLSGENAVFVSPKSIKNIKNTVADLKKLTGLKEETNNE
jgi:transcriptional regulator of arginine metabolism